MGTGSTLNHCSILASSSLSASAGFSSVRGVFSFASSSGGLGELLLAGKQNQIVSGAVFYGRTCSTYMQFAFAWISGEPPKIARQQAAKDWRVGALAFQMKCLLAG